MLKSNKKTIAAAILVSALATGCASLPDYVKPERVLESDERLRLQAWPVQKGGASVCPNRASGVGAFITNRPYYHSGLRDAAEARYGVGRELKVVQVYPGSPAERAGLRTGDIVISVASEDAPTGSDATLELVQTIGKLSTDRGIEFKVERAGQQLALNIVPEHYCPSVFGWWMPNAEGMPILAALDNYVGISDGLVALTRSDDEMRIAIAHGLAHNALSHLAARGRRAKVGAAADGLLVGIFPPAIVAFPFLPATRTGLAVGAEDDEIEADRLAIQILAAGGYDVSGVPDFWRRVEAAKLEDSTGTRMIGASHPVTSKRLEEIMAAINETKQTKIPGPPVAMRGAEADASNPEAAR